MLRKTYDALTKQLQMNMDCQDFYKNPFTNLWINSNPTMVFRHPLYVLNVNQENVFPERAQIVIKRNIGKARIRLIDGHAYWVNSDFIKLIN